MKGEKQKPLPPSNGVGSRIWSFLNSYQCTPFVILVYVVTYLAGLALSPMLTAHPTFTIKNAQMFYTICCVVVGVCICLFVDAGTHFILLQKSFIESRGFYQPSQDGNVVIMTIFGLTGITHMLMASDTTPVYINYCGRGMHLARLSEWTAVVFFVARISSQLDERYSEFDAMRAGMFQLVSVLTGTFAMVVDQPMIFFVSMAISHIFYFDIFRDVYRHHMNIPLVSKSTTSTARLQAMYRAVVMSWVIAVIFTSYTLVWWLGAFHCFSDETEMSIYSVLDMIIKGTFTTLVIKAHVAASVQNEHELSEQVRHKLRSFVQYALHELRVPLNTMTLATDELKHSQPAKRQKSAIKLLESMLGVVSRLLTDALDFQRIAAGRLQLEKEDIDMRGLATAITDQLKRQANSKSLMLKQECKLSKVYVRADTFKVTQVLRNLVENACKFSPNGETITIRIEREGADMVRTYVQDNGVGISPENQKKLFKPFAQIGPGKLQGGGGTGLGLYISRAIVEAHGGVMSLESEEGKGATFSFTLPHSAGPPSEAKKIQEAEDMKSLRILVVDDNKVNRKLLARLCRRLGHDADLVSSGEEALEVCGGDEMECTHPYDLVLMDQWMPPGMSGTACIRQLKKRNFSGVIIGVTGDDDASDGKDGSMQSAGALCCLAKPVTRAKILESLKKVQVQALQ
uniref:histidine kinase n=1 Tax=Lotharella oceanica TaxID=641309 RepID=A0A7S2TZT2_9EUKA